MVQIDGTYEFVSQENYSEYLKSLGLSDEAAQKQAAVKTAIAIKSATADSITLAYGERSVVFPYGKEVDHTLSAGHTVYTTVTRNGNNFTFNTKLAADGSLTEEKVFSVNDSGLTSSSTNSKGVKTVRRYNRV